MIMIIMKTKSNHTRGNRDVRVTVDYAYTIVLLGYRVCDVVPYLSFQLVNDAVNEFHSEYVGEQFISYKHAKMHDTSQLNNCNVYYHYSIRT